VRGTIGRSSGKKYFEVTLNIVPAGENYWFAGIADADHPLGSNPYSSVAGYHSDRGVSYYATGGQIGAKSGAIAQTCPGSFVVGDVMGIAVNLWTRELYGSKNGVWGAAPLGDPVLSHRGLPWGEVANDEMFVYAMLRPVYADDTIQITLNEGGSAFAYGPPPDYEAWDIAPATVAVPITLGPRVLDSGLAVLDSECSAITVCSQAPTTYTEATSTYALGSKSLGAGNVFGAPQDYTP
jgi:hypothetical protein